MKTLKLTMVVVLVSCSVLLMARPTSGKKSMNEAKQELYKDVKSNLVRWGTMQAYEGNNNGEFIVHCKLNQQNEVEIMRIIGSKEELKQRVIETMQEHPVKADKALQGEHIAFVLKFEQQ
jgi:hypothetical protein